MSHETFELIERLQRTQKRAAMATLVRTRGTTPRKEGTKMFVGENGDRKYLAYLRKGDFFGEMAVLESVPRTADAVAVSDVRVVVINGARFDEMLRKNPEVAVRIIRKYSKRLREANALLERLVGK